jgi:anti-sigma regulatory factor (Ser/Thr protein kinase)
VKEEFILQCSPENFCEVRRALRKFLAPLGFPEDTAELLVLAVDEACANILRHAYEGSCKGSLSLSMDASAEELQISIRDQGKPCDPKNIRSRALEDFRPGGLGVFFIQQAFDSVEYLPQTDGTLLLLKKKIQKSGT